MGAVAFLFLNRCTIYRKRVSLHMHNLPYEHTEVGSQQPHSYNSQKQECSGSNGKWSSTAPSGNVTNYILKKIELECICYSDFVVRVISGNILKSRLYSSMRNKLIILTFEIEPIK